MFTTSVLRKKIISCIFLGSMVFGFMNIAYASLRTVEEQDMRVSAVAKPIQKLFVADKAAKDSLLSNLTVGVMEGADSNPLLDSTKKADAYTQETLDMDFSYPLAKLPLGNTTGKFGFNLNNINYATINDVDTFDCNGYVGVEQEIRRDFLLGAGYDFELLWFPHDTNGTFFSNEANAYLKEKVTKWFYHKIGYKFAIRNYTGRQALLSNGVRSDNYREDLRNAVEYELGFYLGKDAKLRVTGQYLNNDSNYQYLDYYDYNQYKVGSSLTWKLVPKLYSISAFYWLRKEYNSRTVSDNDSFQRDNLYIASQSFMYELTKRASIFANYSFRENHTNEPTERYTENVCTAGIYYSF